MNPTHQPGTDFNVHLLDSLQFPHVDILADKTSIDSAVLFTGKKLLSKIFNKKSLIKFKSTYV